MAPHARCPCVTRLPASLPWPAPPALLGFQAKRRKCPWNNGDHVSSVYAAALAWGSTTMFIGRGMLFENCSLSRSHVIHYFFFFDFHKHGLSFLCSRASIFPYGGSIGDPQLCFVSPKPFPRLMARRGFRGVVKFSWGTGGEHDSIKVFFRQKTCMSN